ncbi:MAG: hypothetical protein C4576_12370 [Desulfobacteraceae bacterium]|nr:MAG: hypothetical protein C4576_12370 [Desulfobacteraceae bacterium]
MNEPIASTLEEMEPGDALVIDAKGVEVFDYSFANELFGKTMLRIPDEYPGRFVIIENLTTYTRENLIKALESMNLAMIERKDRTLRLIGKVHPADEKTFTAIVGAGKPKTAAFLSDKLKVNLTAMNERLSKLVSLGLVRREKGTSQAGREQYEYMVPS